MTKQEFVSQIAEETGLTKADTEKFVKAFTSEIMEEYSGYMKSVSTIPIVDIPIILDSGILSIFEKTTSV